MIDKNSMVKVVSAFVICNLATILYVVISEWIRFDSVGLLFGINAIIPIAWVWINPKNYQGIIFCSAILQTVVLYVLFSKRDSMIFIGMVVVFLAVIAQFLLSITIVNKIKQRQA